jgi:hypothetical protein
MNAAESELLFYSVLTLCHEESSQKKSGPEDPARFAATAS